MEEEARENRERAISAGPFQASWESLQRYLVPDWYQDAKFGIFIHWGVFSVPAFENEWYARNMYLQNQQAYQHHIATYGSHETFGYKDFIPSLTANRFDPDAWATLFHQAGARYVVPVAEHHDGFAMYDCSFSPWNVAQMGPRRDMLGELAEAVRHHGMTFGLSYHRAEHWWYMNGGRTFPSDVQDAQFASFYGPARPKEEPPDDTFLSDWLLRLTELVERYAPQLVYFDWWIEEPAFQPYLQQFAAYYYNRAVQRQQPGVINYKHVDRTDYSFADGTAVFDIERGQANALQDHFWQSDTSIALNSWGYVEGLRYKSVASLLGDLVDVVSKNGTLLLNICHMADGTIPQPEQDILLAIGRWLSINGEAIYATRPWTIFGEGPTQIAAGNFSDAHRALFTSQDIRFTTSETALFATMLAWPEDDQVLITSLALESDHYPHEISSVELLGSGELLNWTRDEAGLHVQLPAEKPCEHAGVLRIR